MAASSERVDIAAALREAAKTAVLSFVLFLPLIGFYTHNDIHNALTFETRLPLLLTFVVVIAGGRVL
jgi:hypothetical protein